MKPSAPYQYKSQNSQFVIIKLLAVEKQYQRVTHKVPHKFCLFYLLAKLYNEFGQYEKAIVYTYQMLKNEIMVSLMLIQEMQKEIEQILSTYTNAHNKYKVKVKGKNYTKYNLIGFKLQFW